MADVTVIVAYLSFLQVMAKLCAIMERKQHSSCRYTPKKRKETVRGQRTRWLSDSAACDHLFAWEISVQFPPDVERNNMH